MRLVSAKALRSIQADSQIAVALLPLFERAPITIGSPHLPFEHASEEL